MIKKHQKKQKVGVIIPTIREDSIKKFITEWENELTQAQKFFDLKVYIVEDNPKKNFKLNVKYVDYLHVSWFDIQQKLGKDAWIISRRSDVVRSFGYLLAYWDKCDYFITLDDDCYPYLDSEHSKNFIGKHIDNLTKVTLEENRWFNTILDLKPRGLPYENIYSNITYENVVVNHGLWVNVPDFDAVTSFGLERSDGFFNHVKNSVVPISQFFPMCGMNLSWKRSITPLMYFLLMGQDGQGNNYEFDRFGDIWCGLFCKKILDNFDLRIKSGDPVIFHSRASSKYTNLIKEAKGIGINEFLWKDVENITLSKSSTIKKAYKELTEQLPNYSKYWVDLQNAMKIWIELF